MLVKIDTLNMHDDRDQKNIEKPNNRAIYLDNCCYLDFQDV